MTDILFTSDFHLGDERMELLSRPFEDEDECANKILQNLKNSISALTELYVIGDLALTKNWLSHFNEATKIAKKRTLILGNYDKFPLKEYNDYFDEVVDSYIDLTLLDMHERSSLDVRLHHYPSQYATPKRFSLCGHIHGAWKVQKNMLNVGVDVHHFRPITVEQAFFYFRAIKDFYDQDVWVGNHIANKSHSYRGQEGTYWERNFSGSYAGS